MDHQETVVNTCLTFFGFLGLHPYKKTQKVQTFCFLLGLFVTLILAYLRLCYEKVDFALISDTFESTMIIIHVSAKFVTLLLSKSTIRNLLDRTKLFWYPKNSEIHKGPLQKLLFLLRKFQIFVIVTLVAFGSRPIFDKSLAIPCYVPPFIPRPIFVIFNNAIFLFCGLTVGSFDMFLGAMVVVTAIQFKILKSVILTLDGDYEKVRNCINYQNFLDSFLKDVSSVVSPALLVYFGIAPVTVCFELYFISKSSNWAEIAKSSLYMTGIGIEMFCFYCIPATYLMVESETMINAVYNSGWENSHQLSIRKIIIIMMQRLQKDTVLTAAKMVKINMATCTNAIRMVFSFYTSLQLIDERAKSKWE